MSQSKVEVITKKLNAAQALVAKYTAELAAIENAVNIAAGTVVSFAFGRGDKVTTLTGKVIATGTQANGVAVATVIVNEGTIDADIKRVPISGLTIVTTTAPAEASPEDTVPAADPLEASAAVVADPAPAADAAERSVDALLQ